MEKPRWSVEVAQRASHFQRPMKIMRWVMSELALWEVTDFNVPGNEGWWSSWVFTSGGPTSSTPPPPPVPHPAPQRRQLALLDDRTELRSYSIELIIHLQSGSCILVDLCCVTRTYLNFSLSLLVTLSLFCKSTIVLLLMNKKRQSKVLNSKR